MTKEEILNNETIKIGNLGFHTLLYNNSRAEEVALNAMDEYAKQFGENLIGWLNENDFKFTGFKDNMQSDYVNNGEMMHASEIVELFIEQQNKP